MFTTGETVGLAEWIIEETKFLCLPQFFLGHGHKNQMNLHKALKQLCLVLSLSPGIFVL